MRRSVFIIGILSVLLVLGMLFAGCTQSQSSPAAPYGGAGATPAPTAAQAAAAASVQQTPAADATTPVVYDIQVSVVRKDPATVTVSYQGGQSAASLQQLVIMADNQTAGTIDPPSGQLFVVQGTSSSFPVPGSPSHIRVFGHFLNGVQSVFDQNL